MTGQELTSPQDQLCLCPRHRSPVPHQGRSNEEPQPSSQQGAGPAPWSQRWVLLCPRHLTSCRVSSVGPPFSCPLHLPRSPHTRGLAQCGPERPRGDPAAPQPRASQALTWRLYALHRACRSLAAACWRSSEQVLGGPASGPECSGEGLLSGPGGRGSSCACREFKGQRVTASPWKAAGPTRRGTGWANRGDPAATPLRTPREGASSCLQKQRTS